ncbi:GBF-interacting protein 1-like [Macadamia integrifolia]|uniref:GBF-interacting protein 1-like n=1 Tax=Macadamia integrifolia TaxID=60698 RepID=UPI001C4F9324|nr:GBF-interacting protein 1-like [Macadamia integrifolia]
MSSGFRVSIPNNVRKTIQNIKEIAGNHSDEEIYTMLKECSMDPNETAQKLLLQDTFHEVRRKRDKRKENLNNRDPADSKWKSGLQGRGVRGGHGNYSPRYVSHDTGGGRNAMAGKENGVNQGTEKGVTPSLPAPQDTENKATTPVSSSVTVVANGLSTVATGNSSHGRALQLPMGSGTNKPEEGSGFDAIRPGSGPPHPNVNAKSNVPASALGVSRGQPIPSSDRFLASMTPASVSGVYSSALDPVLVPSMDSRLPGVVGTIKRQVGSQRLAVEPIATISADSKSAAPHDSSNCLNKTIALDVTESELSSSLNEKAVSEIGNAMHGRMPGKSLGVDRNQLSEPLQPTSSTHGGSTASRPSSNYNNRSQQLVGPQKGPSKEWKPKPTSNNTYQASGAIGTSDGTSISVEAGALSQPSLSASASEEATSNLQKKLEDLHFSNGQHVIIPNHLHVPEAERTGLSFGSFDASFGISASYTNGPDSDKSSTPLSEYSQGIEEAAEEGSSSNQNASPTAQEEGYPDHPSSPTQMPENLSAEETDFSSSQVAEYDQAKPETALPSGGPQYSVVHTAPNFSFGFLPSMVGGQLAPFENSEPQVQQPFDPSTSYYTQFYRPGADGDGRFSPFLAPGTATKYNGNIAVLSPPTGQSPQEGGNSLVLSTAAPTPLATQASGVLQNSIAVTQQPVPVFRQPAGVHISHYPPNYIPYSQYFSPFYVQPPTIHHFLSNTAYPQQPPTGNVYPPPTAAAATGVKYSLSQYKPGINTSNSTHIGMATGYGPYSSSPAGYNPSPATTAGNSTGNEDLAASPFKENNIYITGQQSEGPAVWFPAPGRDISGLPASSFYNLPPQGQHVAFAPTQAGHGAFAGIYHPAQTVAAATVHPLLQQSQTMAGAVEMVGSPAGVYQQPQRAQMNWTNNY